MVYRIIPITVLYAPTKMSMFINCLYYIILYIYTSVPGYGYTVICIQTIFGSISEWQFAHPQADRSLCCRCNLFVRKTLVQS